MGINRLEAFSDGVIAIIVTIMVLDLHVPRDASLAALRAEAPLFRRRTAYPTFPRTKARGLSRDCYTQTGESVTLLRQVNRFSGSEQRVSRD